MHSDHPTQLYSTTPLVAQAAAMSSTSRSRSPQPTRQRPHHQSPKDQKVAHLSNLPRFHPAVYQPPTTTSHSSQQAQSSTPSPVPQRPSHPYRVPSASRDALRQYRELVASVALAPRSTPSNIYTKPSTPQLDPLGSPGPVTPLALEDSDNYFVAGESQTSNGTPFLSEGTGPSAELVERLIQRESERRTSHQQGGRIETKAR